MTELGDIDVDTGTGSDSDTDDEDPVDDRRRIRLRRFLSHPATVTALIGVLTTALDIWWVHRFREVGNYNVDEVGYMATALRFHRGFDLLHPIELLRTIGAPSPTGPLVPLLAVPLVVVLGRNVEAVMAIQPLLAVLAAVAAAGIANRTSGRSAGIVAGIVTLCIPAAIQSARGFQYATAAAAFLALALWALLRSDRGRHRPSMLLFGLSVGLMLLSRTMSVGFLPALAVAVVLQVRRDRRAWANVGLAAATTAVVAGPWWFLSRGPLYDYLVGFGFGHSSQFFGDAGLWGRLDRRWTNVEDDLHALGWVVAAILAVSIVVGVIGVARRSSDRRVAGNGIVRSEPNPRWVAVVDAPLTTVGVVVVVGFLTLFATRNQGVWFELPIDVLVAVFVTGLAARFPRPLRFGAYGALVSVAVSTFAVSLTDSGGVTGTDIANRTTMQRAQIALYGGLIDRERPLSDADPALGSDDPAVRTAVAHRWWRANNAVVDRIDQQRRRTGDRTFVWVSGNSHLINGQSLLLAQELRGLRQPPSGVPDTSAPTSELRRDLSPTWDGGFERFLVLITSRSQPFPEDRDVARLRALATADGWRTMGAPIPLPDGGEVEFMAPPDG